METGQLILLLQSLQLDLLPVDQRLRFGPTRRAELFLVALRCETLPTVHGLVVISICIKLLLLLRNHSLLRIVHTVARRLHHIGGSDLICVRDNYI